MYIKYTGIRLNKDKKTKNILIKKIIIILN